jgi:hypothetical protein
MADNPDGTDDCLLSNPLIWFYSGTSLDTLPSRNFRMRASYCRRANAKRVLPAATAVYCLPATE